MKNPIGLFWATVVLFCPGVSKAAPVQWPVSDGGNGHFYEAVACETNITWGEAKSAAEEAGGYLACITSQEENMFVFSLVRDRSDLWFHPPTLDWTLGPWLGGYQPNGSPEPAGGWQWLSGEAWNYTDWHPGQPDNYWTWKGMPENYLNYVYSVADPVIEPYWNDASYDVSGWGVGAEVRGYVVEYEYSQPPSVSSSVQQPVLWPPNHKLVNVWLTVTAFDHASAPLPATIHVFCNENDPNAASAVADGLWVRAERVGNVKDGRIYLIVAEATDSVGNVGFASCTVVVPHDASPRSASAVNRLGADAKAYCDSHEGTPPPGYFLIANGSK